MLKSLRKLTRYGRRGGRRRGGERRENNGERERWRREGGKKGVREEGGKTEGGKLEKGLNQVHEFSPNIQHRYAASSWLDWNGRPHSYWSVRTAAYSPVQSQAANPFPTVAAMTNSVTTRPQLGSSQLHQNPFSGHYGLLYSIFKVAP